MAKEKSKKIIELYSNGCPKCLVIKAILNRKEIPYIEVNNEDNIIDKMNEFKYKLVPFAIIKENGKEEFLDFSKIALLEKGEFV